MGYAQESGYTPSSIETIMANFMAKINTQFDTTYTMETFIGTNAYKYFYAIAQLYQGDEVKTSEIFQKLQNYFDFMNARISRPAGTNPGIIEQFQTLGYTASVKKMILSERGLINICVDVDDGAHSEGEIEITAYSDLTTSGNDDFEIAGVTFTASTGSVTPGDGTFQAATDDETTASSLAAQVNAHATASALVKATAAGPKVLIFARHGGEDGNALTLVYNNNAGSAGATVTGSGTLEGGEDNEEYPDKRLEICTKISQICAGGAVTQGLETESIVHTNGQSFDYSFHLPNRLSPTLRLTLTLSENNQLLVGNPDDTKQLLLANIASHYRLGRNFEPQTYFTTTDAPWTSEVLLEYSLDYDSEDPESATWSSDIYEANFDDLFEVTLANIILVEE